MNETETPHEEKSFNAHIDDDLAMVNTPSVDQSINDAQFLSRASQASETFLQTPTQSQPEALKSLPKKIAANVALGAVAVVPMAIAGGAFVGIVDEKIKEDKAQNQEWSGETADQQQLQEQQMVEENKIVLDLSGPDEK